MSVLFRQIKLYYYDTVIERYMETKLEVHRNKSLAEATEIAWKVSSVCVDCVLYVHVSTSCNVLSFVNVIFYY